MEGNRGVYYEFKGCGGLTILLIVLLTPFSKVDVSHNYDSRSICNQQKCHNEPVVKLLYLQLVEFVKNGQDA